MLEKSRRRFGRTGIFGTLPLTGKSCCPSPRSWPTCGRSPSTTGSSATARQRCCRPEEPGLPPGVISNNASLYNVFRVLEDYGIRGFMEDVTVSSVTGYRKPHPEIFRIALRQCSKARKVMRLCGGHGLQGHHRPQAGGFAKPCRSAPSCRSRRMCTCRGCGTAGQGYRNTDGLVTWLDQINPELAPAPGA